MLHPLHPLHPSLSQWWEHRCESCRSTTSNLIDSGVSRNCSKHAPLGGSLPIMIASPGNRRPVTGIDRYGGERSIWIADFDGCARVCDKDHVGSASTDVTESQYRNDAERRGRSFTSLASLASLAAPLARCTLPCTCGAHSRFLSRFWVLQLKRVESPDAIPARTRARSIIFIDW